MSWSGENGPMGVPGTEESSLCAKLRKIHPDHNYKSDAEIIQSWRECLKLCMGLPIHDQQWLMEGYDVLLDNWKSAEKELLESESQIERLQDRLQKVKEDHDSVKQELLDYGAQTERMQKKIHNLQVAAEEEYRELRCPKCNSLFEDDFKDHANGILCPECRRRGYKLVGVVYAELRKRFICQEDWDELKLENKDLKAKLDQKLTELEKKMTDLEQKYGPNSGTGIQGARAIICGKCGHNNSGTVKECAKCGHQFENKRKIETVEFVECEQCGRKPGIPILCPSCLHNRLVIFNLVDEIIILKSKLENHHCAGCDGGDN